MGRQAVRAAGLPATHALAWLACLVAALAMCQSYPLLPPACSTRDLAFAWGLALVCCTHHLGHMLHAMGLHQFAHTGGLTMHMAAGASAGRAAAAAKLLSTQPAHLQSFSAAARCLTL